MVLQRKCLKSILLWIRSIQNEFVANYCLPYKFPVGTLSILFIFFIYPFFRELNGNGIYKKYFVHESNDISTGSSYMLRELTRELPKLGYVILGDDSPEVQW